MASITPFLAYAFPSRPTSVPTIPMRSLIQPQFKSVACRATINENDNNHHRESNSSLQRRDLLIGLGGLYGGAAGIGTEQLAVANPIQAPDLLKCGQSNIPPDGTPINCCPPNNSTIVDFVPPTHGLHRVRRAAHLVDDKYLAKYQKAVALMKALPDDDPRNFTQQANVHCAYCSGGYDQVGFPDLQLQVHNSWLFFPFHRFYLYFHERILGKLIGDDNFALPFWNWDSPAGMQIPSLYNEKSSSLYNERRDQEHLPPTIVDLDNRTNSTLTPGQLIDDNLKIMHREMVSNGRKRRDFTDRDWLDSSFLFYDENKQLVRVKVKDYLKTETLGYKYQGVANPWINSRRSPRVASNGLLTRKLVAGEPVFPVTLEKPVTATVKRPKKGRNKKEKEEEEEVIVVEGILFDRSAYVKFDVFINSSEEVKLRPSESEFAGSFVNVPHKHGQGKKHAMVTTNLRLGITDLLEDLGAEDDDSVKVTLVPATENCSTLKVSGIRIEFSS
ncbi:hypothetical protein HPP92_016517 [Vanilla planifolia]|uniref:Tyrosinase copper-binding domain-containing protein n=1 Tax=Vanilla planifolia TaxID=51239 RepID=A0A835QJ01_VANPL|nr:hypothetical protein HPP92_016517 [Vanilla planifolia]